ncbi:retrotransposon [Fragilaria crotonensis]|nr:retrotransposon [Fragilaria crotonensis]
MSCPTGAGFSLGLLSALPSDNTRPQELHGCGMIAADASHHSSPPTPAAPGSPPTSTGEVPDRSRSCPPIPPAVSLDDEPQSYTVRSLSRAALRMLWHQRLGHLNFRRLSEMHRYVKGMPKFPLPTELEGCPVCLAAKMRKAPASTKTTMRATTCHQGLSIDFGFMVQKSRDTTRHTNLVGLNGETCYVLLTDHYSGRIHGRAFATKAPPVEWLNSWLASNAPDCADKYVRMDGGGELGKCREIHKTFTNFGYVVELTGPDASHQNGPGERPHQTIGDALRAMLSGANLQPNFWPYAFYHYLRLYNVVPHGDRPSNPYEMCGLPLPNLTKLRTFGCRVHVRPTTSRYGRLVPNARLGVFLGYSRSMKVLYYFDIGSSTVKTATHARFDEGMNDLDTPPPNVKLLRNLASDGVVEPDSINLSTADLDITDDPFERLDTLTQPITCEHETLGFDVKECHIRRRGYVSAILPNTSASRIRNVRRKYIGAFIVSINGTAVFTAESILTALQSVAKSDASSFEIVFAPERYIPVHERHLDSPLHLSVDQLRTIATIQASSPFEDFDHDHAQLLVRSLNTTTHGTAAEQGLGSFTRRKLRRLPNWPEWQAAEFKQLDSMEKQNMYGTPTFPPPDAIILRQHWNYAIKGDGTRKARNCCDGSPRAAPQLKLANTYSSCIEQPCMRMFFALCVHEGFVCLKVDATNAYANSPPPDQPTFVRIDDQYADWYQHRFGTPVSRDMVLPVQHALQGHPESGALWEKFVNSVIARHGFTSTTHERSIYHGSFHGHRMLICRQVDDLAIGCSNVDAIRLLVKTICTEDGIDLRDEGILSSFNGVDVEQSDRYIKISCESYIDKLLAHYGWSSSGSRDTDEKPIEPIASSTIQQMFDDYAAAPLEGTDTSQALEMSMGFSYRSVLGALIYAYVVARPDIGYAVTTLARFSDHPAKIHYDALRRVARYLRMTKNWGLLYWRHSKLSSLPTGLFEILSPDLSLPDFPQSQVATELTGYVDAAHATDLHTRRSITGLVFMFGGGPIAYKSKIQPTVSTSSTEAEFIAAVHAAKIAKYLRSILLELGYPQTSPTTLYEDNAAAILMVNAQRPTPRSRHIDIQHFAIQEWKANREIVLEHIPGIVNSADSLTKSLGSTLHHRHARRLMGHYGAPWAPA